MYGRYHYWWEYYNTIVWYSSNLTFVRLFLSIKYFSHRAFYKIHLICYFCNSTRCTMKGESDLARGTYLRVSFVHRWISLLDSKIKDNSRPVETRITSTRERDTLRILFRYSQDSIPTHEVGLYTYVDIQNVLSRQISWWV